MLQDHRYGASASHGVPVYSPAFADTHRTYPPRDGQAELTWVTDYITEFNVEPRWFTSLQMVTRPSTNWGRRRVT